ncbi:MAG: homoserine dehydrogenase [Ruminococcaceae bacterium]|nr:homoserine dehydrogenase [Oscillospiraceae bacterium]
MINVAILGFGVVGSGTAALITENAELIRNKVGDDVYVKRILDLRDFPDSPFAERITHDINDIINDKDISVVCEVIGGLHPAYEFTVAALKAGKSVVTSNKEIVATLGVELLTIAAENNVSYMFEAAVGGGIPVLRPLAEDLATVNRIERVDGILNGTTNYILTRMKDDGATFGDALAGAQKNGYAEADPSADIEGKDTCRKICILGAIAFGKLLDVKGISTTGITALSLSDIENAEKMGYSVKLIGSAFKSDDGRIVELVRPCFVPHSNPLSHVFDVFNGVSVRGNYVGDVMFYGRGAGSEPTASAVASDVIRIASGAAVNGEPWKAASAAETGCADEIPAQYYVCADTADVSAVEKTFGGIDKIIASKEKTAFVLKNKMSLVSLKEKIKTSGLSVSAVIEVL